MRKRFLRILGIFAIFVLLPLSVSSQGLIQDPAQDDVIQSQEAQTEAIQSPQIDMAEQSDEVSELSIYGEVQSVDVKAPSISVQYYDYDKDEEDTLEVSLDKDSKLENVEAIYEVKRGDWVDVTYIVSDGKNTAKIISVEAEEPDAEDYGPMDATEE